MTCRLIGVSGGSGSGKTTLARALVERFGSHRCAVMAQDSYYFDQSARFDGDGGSVNFDHPSSIDFSLMAQHLRELRRDRSVEMPVYDFATHSRIPRTQRLDSHEIILVDGTLLFSQSEIVALLDARIFVETPESDRFNRRLRRDCQERGRNPEGVEKVFRLQVKPMHDLFIEPNKDCADLVVSGLLPIAESERQILDLLSKLALRP